MWYKNWLRQKYNKTHKTQKKMTIVTIKNRKTCLKMLNFFLKKISDNEDKEKAKSHIIK